MWFRENTENFAIFADLFLFLLAMRALKM